MKIFRLFTPLFLIAAGMASAQSNSPAAGGQISAEAQIAPQSRRLVRIHIDQPEQALWLARQPLDFASRRIAPFADAVLDPDEERALEQAGFRLETLMPAARLNKTAAALSGDMGAFHTYQEMADELSALASGYPQIMRLVSIGKSIQGRDLWAVKISDNPGEEESDEAEVLYTATTHAREIITPEILLDFIHFLTGLYGQDSRVTHLVDNRQLWLVPMVNPDGHVRVENGDLWYRKNCRPNPDSTKGVDLNRNFGYMWGHDNYGSSSRSSSETYRGSGPFSEPETQALRDLAARHRFVAVLNYHSYSRLVLFPWSYMAEDTPHHEIFMELARNLARQSGYEIGNTRMGILYSTNGDADDFFYGDAQGSRPVFSFTIEVGDEFHPPENKMSQLISENRPANLYMADVADVLMKDPWRLLEPNSPDDSTATRVSAPDQPQQTRLPLQLTLRQNYPNPFNDGTTIRYQLTQPGMVRLTLFDVAGRPVRVLLAAAQSSGEHTFSFNAGGLPSGVYLCRLETEGGITAAEEQEGRKGAGVRRQTAAIKMLLVR